MRYVGSDMPLIPELNNTELWVYIENSAPNPPSLFVSVSHKVSDITWFWGVQKGYLPELKVRWTAASN